MTDRPPPPAAAPQGWYPDPWAPPGAALRWWDGLQWTGYVSFPTPPRMTPERENRSLDALGRALVILLVASLALSLATLAVHAWDIGNPRVSAFRSELFEGDAGRDGILVVGGLLWLASAVVWLVWQYRAHSVLRRFHAPGELRFTPGWAVAWWLIPLANLVQPYRVFRELLHRSAPTASRRTARLNLWWGLWIAGGVFSITAAAVGGGFRRDVIPTLEQVRAGAWWTVASDAALLGALILALALVVEVMRNLRARLPA